MKKQFIKYPDTHFNEIFQSNVIKFAFVKETATEYIQQHGNVNCRDFLADVLHAEYMKQRFSIYKFTWDPEVDLIDRDATKLVMTFQTDQQLQELKKNLHKLHDLEVYWKLRKTKILTVNKKTAIIIGSRFYLKKGFAISFYTFLLKAFALAPSFEDLTGNEAHYYTSCGSNFDKLIKNFRKVLAYKTTVSGLEVHEPDHVIHNYAGFVAVCNHPTYQKHGRYLESL